MSKRKSREQKLELLRKLLIEGEESGFVENFNPVDFQAELKKEHLANGIYQSGKKR
ncbi:type II toxin-antitoxin system ParD family antitoxin [Dyadobacter sp. CY343]|uniref:type II toxin-antitoxin system ParD family antitoxin n=1 Tax=Dyadobacter sp. CY343 TaxID=2907299 RepID=UPI001F47AA8A|nr:type II toxin-antitoxin system ParD family antitoxin [Dyadobacter sp. CY343]MCE7060861.1 type II toxin-antitoxin system ParD family antitoxin [Dyadobacter sp. CY343]